VRIVKELLVDKNFYSLWLVPNEPQFSEFSQLILRLSREYSTSYFVPHVTILGAILRTESEMVAATEALAAELRPYSINLNAVDYLHNFYNSLFVRVDRTSGVQNSFRRALEIFQVENLSTYDPHLSLMYSLLSDKTKQQIIQDIQGYPKNFVADRLRIYY